MHIQFAFHSLTSVYKCWRGGEEQPCNNKQQEIIYTVPYLYFWDQTLVEQKALFQKPLHTHLQHFVDAARTPQATESCEHVPNSTGAQQIYSKSKPLSFIQASECLGMVLQV